jgi:hypothetical protein
MSDDVTFLISFQVHLYVHAQSEDVNRLRKLDPNLSPLVLMCLLD